jgi:hypothetical protein
MAGKSSFSVSTQYANEAIDRVKKAVNSARPRNISVDSVQNVGPGRYMIKASSGGGITHNCKVAIEVVDNPGTRSCDVIVHDDDFGPGRDGKCTRDGHLEDIRDGILNRFNDLPR